jgi:hypothetical protein
MTVAEEYEEAATRPVLVPGRSPTSNGSAALSGTWHLRLATLLMTLRGCLMVPDREVFDKAHNSAHLRQIPSAHFFSFALDILRQHRPELEGEFREVFRLRNQSRRRAREHSKALRSVKSESSLQDMRAYRGTSMSRSCEDVAAQARSAETEADVDETMFRLQALCVQANSGAPGPTVLTKRHSEIDLHGVYEQKRKMGMHAMISSIDILSCSP